MLRLLALPLEQLQRLGVGLDDGQGRFDLVSGVGDELLLLFHILHDGPDGPAGQEDHQQQHDPPAGKTRRAGEQQHPQVGEVFHGGVQEYQGAAPAGPALPQQIAEAAGPSALVPALIDPAGHLLRLRLRHGGGAAHIHGEDCAAAVEPDHEEIGGQERVVVVFRRVHEGPGHTGVRLG